MEFWFHSGSVRGPFGVRSGSFRDPFGIRLGSVRDRSGSVRSPFRVRLGSFQIHSEFIMADTGFEVTYLLVRGLGVAIKTDQSP